MKKLKLKSTKKHSKKISRCVWVEHKKSVYWKLKHIYREWTAQAPICGLLDKFFCLSFFVFHSIPPLFDYQCDETCFFNETSNEHKGILKLVEYYHNSHRQQAEHNTFSPQFHATSKIYCLFCFLSVMYFPSALNLSNSSRRQNQ